MVSKEMQKELNEQINKELYSAYLYISMGAYAASIGLNGCANWFSVQAKEEFTHADKFYNFIIERGGRVLLAAIDEPPHDFKDAHQMFDETYKHEQFVTDRIHKLVALARKENDFATDNFLQWFVAEQVEEEASVDEILQKIKLTGGEGNGLFMIDQELAARVFVPPVKGA
ncbi:ferritin [Candidatus Omnitrophota bacterium]